MDRSGREAPLPSEMQGRWVEEEEPTAELVVAGGEVTCFGAVVEYDYKVVEEVAGALTVSLEVEDAAKEDSFQRANITRLVITPEGEFFAYNVKFVSRWVRPGS